MLNKKSMHRDFFLKKIATGFGIEKRYALIETLPMYLVSHDIAVHSSETRNAMNPDNTP